MVFNQYAREEVVSIAKETSRKIISEIIMESSFIDCLAQKVAEIVSNKMEQQIRTLETKIDSLEKQLKNSQDEKEEMLFKIDQLEQKCKLNELRFYGLAEGNDDLNEKIQGVLEKNLGLENINIQACFRVGKPSNKSTNKPRAVVVRFESISDRYKVFFNKKKLKNSKLAIVEELPVRRYRLLLLAKEKLGKAQVCTMEGKIFTKINGMKVQLKTEGDVMKITRV